MKKTKIEKITGGTKTTVTEPDGSKTITYNGVSNLHIGRTFTYGTPSSHNIAFTWKHQSSSSTNFSSTVKTGLIFKKVNNLQLNSKEINKSFSRVDYETYENSNDYHNSPAASSKNYQCKP